MIVDNTLVLSDSQAITATAASTNVIDIGGAGTAYGAGAALTRDITKVGMIPIQVSVTEAFNNLTSLTLSIEIDDAVGFGTVATVLTGPTILLAALTLGAVFSWPARLPEGINKRYFRLKYTVAGAAPTTGKIFAGIVAGRQTNP